MKRFFPAQFFLTLFLIGCGEATPEPQATRPLTWAQPVQHESLDNFYKVSDDLYRSKNPSDEAIAAFQATGIKTIINLRSDDDKPEVFEKAGIRLVSHEMRAGAVSQADLIAVLKLFQEAPKPVLVHCWHGSDRTGFIVAGYRLVYQDWTKEDAIREMRKGGYGFHEFWYENIINALNALDVEAVKKEVGR